MADDNTQVRERVLWRGQICTVIKRKPFGRIDLRDSFGFVEENVKAKETTSLRADDDRASFRG